MIYKDIIEEQSIEGIEREFNEINERLIKKINDLLINNKNMILIIEGCDGVGKGYLIEKLSKKLHNSLIMKNLDRPIDGSITERTKIKERYISMLSCLNLFDNIYFIFDRYHASEMIYGFKRGYEAKDDIFFKKLEEKIKKYPHLLILIDRNEDEIKDVFRNRGDDFINESEIEDIRKRYYDFYNHSILNKIIINSSELDKLIKKIKEVE